MATALTERADLMEARAMTLAEKAVEDKAAWLKRLGTAPATAAARRRWLHEVRTVAAYRDRYKVEGRRVLGEPKDRRAEARCRPRRAGDPPCPSHCRRRRQRPGGAQPGARIARSGALGG